MEQPPLYPSSNNDHLKNSNPGSLPSSLQTHPKIKPLILLHSKENEEDPHRVLKNYSKASRNSHFKGRNKSSQIKNSFSKLLKAQSKLSDLKCELDFAKSFQTVLLFSQFKDLPSLSFFSLSLSNLQQNGTQSLETLWKTLPHLKNLTMFEIILQLFPIRDPKTLTKLLKSLRKLHALTSLSFNFFFCPKLNLFHLKILSHHLKRFNQLQSLKLAFENSLVLDNQKSFNDLVSASPSLSSLSKLEISFDGPKEIPSRDVLQLFMGLQHFKALSDLTLNFKSCEITHIDNDDTESLSRIFTYLSLPSLQKLRLHLFRNFDNKCLKTFSQVLTNLASLQTISLNLSFNKGYIAEDFRNFGVSLCNLSSLSSLSLHLSLILIPAVEMIASVLGSLCNLIKLKLQLTDRISVDSCQVIKQLFTNTKLLKSIRYLEIIIPHEQTMTDDDLEALAGSLKWRVTLQNLSLDFGFSGNITNKGIEMLSYAIKGLENLSGLALKFGYNDNINEKTMSLMGDTLSNRPSLRSVKLAFIQCFEIKGFGTLAQVLKEMKDTNDVILHLPASKISGPEADYLKQRKIYRDAWIL